MSVRIKRFWPGLSLVLAMTMVLTGILESIGRETGQSASSSGRPLAASGHTSGELTGTVNLRMAQQHTIRAPRPQEGEVWNLPPNQTEYQQQQASAAQKLAASDQGLERPTGPLVEPNTISKNFKGIDQQGAGCLPPDSDGAVSKSQYLQAVNCRVVVYRKSDNVRVASTNLATFMGDPDFLFDPRALYDNTWGRFVVLASRSADSSTDPNRYYRINVSQTSSGSGAYWKFRVNFGFNPGDWCDFPQLGMTQDAILITCNMFHRNADGTNSFVSTYAVGIAKARLYNGLGFGVPNFIPGGFRVAPPLVAGLPMQQTNIAYFVAANSTADVVTVWKMVCPECDNAPGSPTTFAFQANVPVPAWDQPPLAFNGGGPLLDTGGGGFSQNTVQNGSFIWAVHNKRRVFNSVPLNVPEYYQINISSNTLVRSGVMFPELSSDAWHASVAVNPNNEVSFTYMSATSSRFPDIRIDGCQVSAGDCVSDLGVGTRIILSSSFIQNFDTLGRNRSGDYSSVDLDPSCGSGKQAFGTHEYVDATDHLWDSRIYRFGFGSTC